jgi:hypothetical protein
VVLGVRYRKQVPPLRTSFGVCNCRVGPRNFTPSLSQIPYVNLSIHTARAIA